MAAFRDLPNLGFVFCFLVCKEESAETLTVLLDILLGVDARTDDIVVGLAIAVTVATRTDVVSKAIGVCRKTFRDHFDKRFIGVDRPSVVTRRVLDKLLRLPECTLRLTQCPKPATTPIP